MSCVQRFCLRTFWQNTTSLSWLQTASPDYARLCSPTARLLPSLPVVAPRQGRSSSDPLLHPCIKKLWNICSGVLHRPVMNQLTCNACLQHWHCIKHLQPFAASVPGQQHPMVKPGLLYVGQLQCYDWQEKLSGHQDQEDSLLTLDVCAT